MSRCPTPESVDRILSSPDNEPAFQQLLAHVQSCPACQKEWGALDTDPPTTRSSDGAPPPPSKIPPEALARLKHSPLPHGSLRSIRGSQSFAANATPGPLASHHRHGSGRLEVRCPNCHAPLEVAVDTLLTDLTCLACGSQFSLVNVHADDDAQYPLTKIGRFKLTARIGFGSFGAVWRGHDPELDRAVAVKIPRHAGISADDQEKFFREARAAAQLRHPNIVSVYEVGRDGDHVYIVSDFIAGTPLNDWLSGQQLTSREAAVLCTKIADALHHAHEHGIIHRDLKPANIIIDSAGEPHLTDFGLARRDAGEVTMTLDGQVLGTPAYMSPEQAQGNAHLADRCSDVYSLGVVLFQLLTGELPFRGNTRMIMYQVIHDDPPSPRSLNGNIAKDLETIVLKCLEKMPPRRYATTHEVAEELRRFIKGQPIAARPISWLERRWHWCHTHRAAAALLAAIPIATLVIAAIATLAAVRINQERRKTTAGLYQSLVREAVGLRTSRTPGYRPRAWSLLQQAAALDTPLVDYDALRQEAARSMGDTIGLDPITFDPLPAQVTSLKLGNSSDSVFLGMADGSLAMVSPTTRKFNVIGNVGAPITVIATPANEQALVCATNDERVIRFTRDATVRWHQQQEQSHGNQVLAVVIRDASPTQIIRRGENSHVELWIAGDSQPARDFSFPQEIFSVAVNPPGELLAVGQSGGELAICDLATGALRTQAAPKIGPIHDIAFSADSKFIACAGGDGFAVLNTATGERVSHNNSTGAKRVALSPTNRLCAIADVNGNVRLWSVFANAPFAELAHGEAGASLAAGDVATMLFTNNGAACLLAEGQRLRRWELAKTPETLTVDAHDGGVPGLAFSPDGSALASVGKDGRCMITHLATGSTLTAIAPQPATPLQAVAYHPGGNYLALGGWESGLQIWDIKRQRQVATPLANAQVWSTTFSDDGAQLAAAGKGGVWIWDFAPETSDDSTAPSTSETTSTPTTPFHQLAHIEAGTIFHCAFAPATHDLYWSDGTLTHFDAATRQTIHNEKVRLAAEVMPFGLLSSSGDAALIRADGQLQIQPATTNAPPRSLIDNGPPAARTSGVSISPNGRWAAARAADASITIFDLVTSTKHIALPGAPTGGSPWFWKWSPDSTRLAIAYADGNVCVWNCSYVDSALGSLVPGR